MHGLGLRRTSSTGHPGPMIEERPVRWNHNIHYLRRILDVVPDRAQTALDVGTGDGLLASELRDRVPHVTGLDLDVTAPDSARGRDTDVTWVHGDVMTVPPPTASFDVVASIATVHHLPRPRPGAAPLRRAHRPRWRRRHRGSGAELQPSQLRLRSRRTPPAPTPVPPTRLLGALRTHHAAASHLC